MINPVQNEGGVVQFSRGDRCAAYVGQEGTGIIAVPTGQDVASLHGAGWRVMGVGTAPGATNPPPRGLRAFPSICDGLYTDTTGNTFTYTLIYPTEWAMQAVATGGTPVAGTFTIAGVEVTTNASGIANVSPTVALAVLGAASITSSGGIETYWSQLTTTWIPVLSPNGAAAAGGVFDWPDGSSSTVDSEGRMAIPAALWGLYRSLGWTSVNGTLFEGLS